MGWVLPLVIQSRWRLLGMHFKNIEVYRSHYMCMFCPKYFSHMIIHGSLWTKTCCSGSIKSNIGHFEGASSLVGVLKAKHKCGPWSLITHVFNIPTLLIQCGSDSSVVILRKRPCCPCPFVFVHLFISQLSYLHHHRCCQCSFAGRVGCTSSGTSHLCRPFWTPVA